MKMIKRGTAPPTARKPVAGERSRRPAKGATRKSQPVKTERQPAAWLNRVIVLTGAGIVLVAALQGYIALQSIPVQYIKVTGELAHTRTDLIQEMIQPALVGGFLRADLQRIRTQLEELPWIYQATVQRRWPNALEIHVVEQLPIARWGDSGFLNHEGQVFQSESSQDWQALPRLDGPRGSAQALVAGYQRLVEILAPVHLSVAQLTVDDCNCPNPGDMDDDGDFDLADMSGFMQCFGEDVTVNIACDCANVASFDNVVDLDDWAVLESLITGP